MKKPFHYLIILSFFVFDYQSVFSQNVIIDSLKQVLISSTELDTAQLRLLRKIGDEYYEEDFDSTLHYYNLSLDLSRSLPHHDIEISTLRSFGFLYSFRKNDYEKSLEYFELAKNTAIEAKDSASMAYACSDIGRVFWKQGKNAKALEQHLNVRRIGEAMQSDRIRLRANLSLGIIYNEEGDNEQALKFYKDGLVQADSLGHRSGKGLLLNNMGTAYQDDGNYDKALEQFEAAEKFFSEIESSDRLALVNTNIAENYVLRNEMEKGILYFKKAIDYNARIDNKEQRAMIFSGVASAYFKMKKYSSAIDFANKGIVALKYVETDLYYNDLYKTLAESYDALGNNAKSLEAYKLFLEAKEQLDKREQSKEIKKLLALYEDQKKEVEIQKLSLEREQIARKFERSKYFVQLLIAGLVILIVLGGLIFYNYRYRESKRMDLMKSRIAKDFHDNIGASLNHIKMISNRLYRGENFEIEQKKDVGNIKKISSEVMHEMYDLLWTIDRERCTIGDLVEHMEDHVDKIMRAENYVVKTNFGELDEEVDISMKVKSNIYAIFKEAVHNISKHTISNQVNITLHRKGNNRMLLTIKNDFDKKITEQQFSSNRGLANMKERAAEINGNLSVEEKPNSFLLNLNWKA